MEITFDKKNATEGLIKIKLNKADYQPGVDEKVKDYARKASIKGFRQGKVPPGVIRQMFGKSILVDQVNHLLSHKLSDYIKEANLRIIGEPLPNYEKANAIDWDAAQDLEFEYQIGLVEDFTYELSPKVKIKTYPIEIDDKTIAETVADLRKRFGKITYPDTVMAGDNLIGQLQSADKSVTRESVVIKTEKIRKNELKKFENRKKDEIIEFDITELFDDTADLARLMGLSAEEAKPVNGNYTFKITAISRMEPAPLNQELFDRVFGKDTVQNEEEFLARVKATIRENYERETVHFLNHQIEDYFIGNTRINLPENFLKTWLKATGKGEITEDVLTKEFESYLRSLKWNLIKNRIAEDHNIRVEATEVKAKAKELILSQFGGPAVSAQLLDKLDAIADNYLAHENGQNFMRLYNQLRDEKIVTHIRERITVSEKKVTLDEFRKIVEEHTH